MAEAVRTEIGAISLQSVYDALGLLVAEGLIRRIQPVRIAGSLRGSRRRQPPPSDLSNLRPRGRRRLRGRLRPVSHAGRRPGLRDRRGRGRLLGALSGLSRAVAPASAPRPPHARDAAMRSHRPTPVAEADVTWTNVAEVPVLEQVAHRPIEPRLVAESVEPERPPHEPPGRRSDGRGVRLRRRVQDARSRRREEGHRGGDDGLAGLVAGRLRPLRRPLHPDGVAQRGHLPHPRRPRRRGFGPDPLCAARQLARQREHRQGAPAALAGQAEVRPEDLVGRPDGADRQRRARVDGVQDASASPAAARTSGSPSTSTGDRRARGSATSATAAIGSSPIRSAPCRWASST